MQTNGNSRLSWLRRFGVTRWLTGFASYVWSWIAPWMPSMSMLSQAGDSDGSTTAAASGARFAARFEQLYGDVHPQFVLGSYEQACARARADFRLLVIYLHSERHPLADRFCRDVLAQPQLARWLDDNCTVWAASILESDAWALSSAMACSGFPFGAVAFCANALGGVTVVERIEGPAALASADARLRAAVETHTPLLLQHRLDAEDRARDRALRDEQDAEYRRALADDQEREHNLRMAAAQEQAERDRRRDEQRQAERRLEELGLRRQQLRARLAPEPATGTTGSTALVIRLIDGSRLQRRFMASETIQAVRDFIDACGYEGPEPPERYELLSNYPRRTFSDGRQTLADAGLLPTAQLFIQETLTDDELQQQQQ
eukprot:TRINITY_DN30895_c0_g1_i1.p1 TRINITY_DN30895_c0_g1~~TRINITY_DN30895_c0_g1_i1.p1  ORF type:complete len:375 (+),score=177.38 TRINITY_DN30895_c0_g1_i1:220-1344(+)